MYCKDCLHIGVCRYASGIRLSKKEPCADFMGFGEWVKLPCRVGNILYKITYSPCHLGETYPDSYGCSGCYDKCDIKLTVTEVTAHSTRYILDNIMPYMGETVFLTREEAKRALKERERNDK